MVLNIICRYALLLKVTLPRNGHQSITTWQDGCSLALGTIRYWVMVHVIGHPAPHLSPCLATCVAQAKVSCKFYFKDFPPRYKVRHNLQHLSWIYHVHSPKYWMDGHIFFRIALKYLYMLSEQNLCSMCYLLPLQEWLQWHHNGHDDISNHQPHNCLLNRLFRCRSKKTSKLRVTGHCAGNSPVSGEFPAQRASNAENVSIWRRHHGSSESSSICCCPCRPSYL